MMHVSTRHHYHENYATRQRLEIIKWPKGNAAGTNIAVQLLATVHFHHSSWSSNFLSRLHLVSLLQDFVIIWIWMTFTSQVGASTFGLTGMTASTPLDRSLDTSSYSCMFGLARLASPSQHHFQIVPRLPWFLVHQMRACYNLLMPLHCHAHLKLEQIWKLHQAL